MKNSSFAFAVIGIILIAAVVGVVGYRFKNPPSPTGETTQPAPTNSVRITNATLTSGGILTLSVKNVGQSNMISISYFLTPAPESSGYGGGWNPSPAATYPIYPGESTRGVWTLFLSNPYRPGLQVTVSVTASFTGGASAWSTYIVIVSQ